MGAGAAASGTAIQQVLQTAELLRMILDYFDLRGDPALLPDCGIEWEGDVMEDIDWHTLYKCALVSRNFSRHALDILWRHIDDIEDLLTVLPSVRKLKGRLMLTGDVTPAQWSRFQSLAVRVRELDLQWWPEDLTMWTILARKCHGQPLLPNLRFLRATFAQRTGSTPLPTLLSPQLHAFDIHFHASDNRRRWQSGSGTRLSATSTFEVLVSLAPHLRTLSWDAPSELPALPVYLNRVVDFVRLENLTFTGSMGADLPLLVAISTIRTLRTLSLTIAVAAAEHKNKTAYNAGAFPNLHTLRVFGTSRDMALFSDLLRSSPLEMLIFSLSDPAITFSALRTDIKRLCENLPPTMTVFSFHPPSEEPAMRRLNRPIPPPRRDPGGPYMITDILSPLLVLRNLTDVTLDPVMSSLLQITDHELAAVGSAWPHLEFLNLFGRSHWMGEKILEAMPHAYPTAHGLVALIRGCPELSLLQLRTLDISALPTVSLPATLPNLHPLKYLHFKTITRRRSITPARFTRFLFRLCPLLRDLDFEEVQSYLLPGGGADDMQASLQFRRGLRIIAFAYAYRLRKLGNRTNDAAMRFLAKGLPRIEGGDGDSEADRMVE